MKNFKDLSFKETLWTAVAILVVPGSIVILMLALMYRGYKNEKQEQTKDNKIDETL